MSRLALRYFLHQLAVGFARAQKLSGPKRRLYTALSWLMVAVGCVLVGAVMFKTRSAFGLPMGRAPMEGLRLQFFGWIAVTLLSIPTLFYVGMVIVGSLFAVAMLALGKFSLPEAWAYALYAQPPERWLASAA
jgi:hypothetical protein